MRRGPTKRRVIERPGGTRTYRDIVARKRHTQGQSLPDRSCRERGGGGGGGKWEGRAALTPKGRAGVGRAWEGGREGGVRVKRKREGESRDRE